MIVGIGMCMLIVGLIGIVILQILRTQMLEGFEIQLGTGCMPYPNDKNLNERNCKNFQNQRANGTMTDQDYADYKTWCDSCTECEWDSDKRECNVKSGYVPPDSTIPDAAANPCDGPCSSIGSESTCNGCAKCVTCVGTVDLGTSTSDNKCINKSDYTQEKCPNTLPFDMGGDDDDSPSSSDNAVSKEQEERHRKEREAIDSADTMDYITEESPESAKAKEKNSRSKFLRDFKTIVHNELLNEQGMTTANSQEYLRDKARRRRENMKLNQKRGCPDMSEYVRKDSIPCWGCTLE
jgi:hypothetical protein